VKKVRNKLFRSRVNHLLLLDMYALLIMLFNLFHYYSYTFLEHQKMFVKQLRNYKQVSFGVGGQRIER